MVVNGRRRVNPLPDNEILRLVHIQTNCRRRFKVQLKWENEDHMGSKTLREKEKLLVNKQFLLFSQCFPQLYISLVHQNAALCGKGLKGK